MEPPTDLRVSFVLAAGAALVVGGVVLGAALRARGGRLGIELAGVGPVSAVTQTVAALALIGIGYHVVVHAAGLEQFRAPLPVAGGVGIAAVLGSLLIDAIERRRADASDADHSP